MDSPDDEHRSEGFAGPAAGQVDFTSSGDESMKLEVQELQGRIVNYIHQRGSASPSDGDVAAQEIVRRFVMFHQGNEEWNAYTGKSFVKGYLIDRLCDFFSYSIEINKRLDDKKAYMLYPQVQQMSLDIFFVGTVLAGLNKAESRDLYLALNQMLAYKMEQRKFRLGDQPVRMEVVIDSDQHIELNGYHPSPARIRSKVPRMSKKLKEQMLAGN